MKNTPVVLKSIAKVPNQKVTKRPKCFSSSDGLVQICVTHGFRTKQQHFSLTSALAMLFSRFEVTQGDSNRSLKNYGFLYDAIVFTCSMRTNHFAT